MQEIASNVYIDQNSVGLIIGLIRNGKETVLIDAPQWHGESGSWRSSTTRLDIAKPRYLIVLDTHYDRLLSLRGSDSVIVAQSEAISPIRSRTSANKSSDESPPQTENPDQISSSSSRMCCSACIVRSVLGRSQKLPCIPKKNVTARRFSRSQLRCCYSFSRSRHTPKITRPFRGFTAGIRYLPAT